MTAAVMDRFVDMHRLMDEVRAPAEEVVSDLFKAFPLILRSYAGVQ